MGRTGGFALFAAGVLCMLAAFLWRHFDDDERPIRYGLLWGFAETMNMRQRALLVAGFLAFVFGLLRAVGF